jgi:Deoxyxylulose-5-phosphate synthase
LDHGSRSEILEEAGLSAQHIARNLVAQVLGTKVPVARPLPDSEGFDDESEQLSERRDSREG